MKQASEAPKLFFPAALNFGFGILRKLLPYPQLPKITHFIICCNC